MMKYKQMELPLAEVAQTPKQAEETLPPNWWTWVEPCVWTESMSNALLKGVKGGKWSDHKTWPNAYFAKLGLFSLDKAFREALFPLRR